MARIAFFLPSLRGGGAERVCLNLASGILGRGHQVDLVFVQASGALFSAVPDGAEVVDLGARRTALALAPLVRYLRHRRPEALISAPDYVNPIALWAGILSQGKTQLIVTNHANVFQVKEHSSKIQERLYPVLMHWFARRASAIVSVSHGAADALARQASIPRERIRVIYNPIVGPEIETRMAEPLDHPWFEAGAPPVILAVGRLEAEKDHATLLRAFAQLRKERPARLVILGEGSLRETLLSLAGELSIRSDLELHGFDLNPYRYMARSGVMVLSSAWEGLPTVLVEAMACGVPVVATRCPDGPAEILEDGRYGALVPVGDASALARAILNTLERPIPSARLQARAADFSFDAATSAYLQLLGLE